MTRRDKGFTLLELLVGMTLTTAVLSSVVIGLHVAARAWQQGEARLRSAYQETERVDFLARQVASLVPYAVVSADPELPGRFVILEASAARLRFLSTYCSRYRRNAGLVLVEYAILEAPSGEVRLALRETEVADDQALLRRLVQGVSRNPQSGERVVVYRPFLPDEADIELMSGLAVARFDYFDPQPAKPGGAWLPEWPALPEAAYPAAIRLHWQRQSDTGELVFPVRARVVAQ